MISAPLYPKNGVIWSSWVILQGESQCGSIIKLQDHCPGFQNITTPVALFTMASQYDKSTGFTGGREMKVIKSEEIINSSMTHLLAFFNIISDLTFDVGKGNPGLIGVRYLANNEGTMRDVTIQTSDVGLYGLGLDIWYQGPCYIRGITVTVQIDSKVKFCVMFVKGFQYGIETNNGQYSDMLEYITVMNQTVYGFYSFYTMVFAIRNFTSVNSVPAIYLYLNSMIS